jgi:hypothetical protein
LGGSVKIVCFPGLLGIMVRLRGFAVSADACCCLRKSERSCVMRIHGMLIPCFLLCLSFVSATVTHAAIGPVTGKPTIPEDRIISAEFGLFNPPDSGKEPFVATRMVPLTENQGYGWVILLETRKPKIRWREEFTLPSAPSTWGNAVSDGSHVVCSDGRVSVLEREVEPEQGLISNSWTVAPGDPKGRYVIRVIIEGTLERVFEFDVQ